MPYPKLSNLFLKVILITCLLVIGFFLYQFIYSDTKNINFAENKYWRYFPGAQAIENGIHFTPLNRIIIHQDGSVGQPNPPVNIDGQHLEVKGDFKITAIASQIDRWASFRLYASVPIIYDQWRYEPPSIEITLDVANNLVTARIWDGSSSYSMDMRTYSFSLKNQTTITLEHTKDTFNIITNNYTLGSIPDHSIFSNGEIWFGADGAKEGTGWTLISLKAEALGQGSVNIIDSSSLIVDQSNKNSLRNLADSNGIKMKIGSTVALGPLVTDEKYRNLALGQFNILTPENSMKPQFIHPEPETYVFQPLDQIIDIAVKNNIVIHGHALVYDKSSPDWMTKSLKENRQKIMVSHIQNVVSHFKGNVAEWDVVNEPFSKKWEKYKNGKTGLEENIWFEAMGEEYIDLAFKTARATDPTAKLYLNDYGMENDGERWNALLRLVKRLKQRGVPIDGIGFEAHIYGDGDYINANQLKKHMEILAGLGLLARISEVDVTGDDAKQQINQYVSALDVCLRASNCTSYTTWGISDAYGSTTRSDRYPLVYGTSLLWDKDFKPKLAYTALQERLKQ